MPSYNKRKDLSIIRGCTPIILILIAFSCADCFPLVISLSPSPHSFRHKKSPLLATSKIGDDLDLSSALIAQLAEFAIKRRLADQRDVTCELFSKSSDLLLRGRVGPVTVKGKGWQSELGLTCRAIEATVGTCELDVGRILTERKLLLTTPAQGKAMIALNSEDFGNFITHPLMKPPSFGTERSTTSMIPDIQFLKQGTNVDPVSGTVSFGCSSGESIYDCILKRGSSSGGPAIVEVVPVDKESTNDDQALDIAGALGKFFNDMVFELDGTFLSYRDLLVTDEGKSPSVMLALNIRVVKFPSPGVEF